MQEINCEKDFMKLPPRIRLQAWEYYALAKAELKKDAIGETLEKEDRERLFELLPIICDYNLSADLCGVNLGG